MSVKPLEAFGSLLDNPPHLEADCRWCGGEQVVTDDLAWCPVCDSPQTISRWFL